MFGYSVSLLQLECFLVTDIVKNYVAIKISLLHSEIGHYIMNEDCFEYKWFI